MGGVPAGAGVVNYYVPTNPVLGEGPLWISPNCTTTLTDGQVNALTAEIFAAVDCLGLPFNAGRVDNLCRALADRFDLVQAGLDNFVRRDGDTMEGPLNVVCPPVNDNEAACKAYVDETAQAAADACCRSMQDQIDNILAGLGLDRFVRRDGDQMSGPLMLYADPGPTSNPNQAATKNYVDISIGRIIVAPEPPTGVQQDRLWLDSSTGKLYCRYQSPSSISWIQIEGRGS